jgi:hypothetical protein
VLDVTFACPDLTTLCRLDELSLDVTGQRLEALGAWPASVIRPFPRAPRIATNIGDEIVDNIVNDPTHWCAAPTRAAHGLEEEPHEAV